MECKYINICVICSKYNLDKNSVKWSSVKENSPGMYNSRKLKNPQRQAILVLFS